MRHWFRPRSRNFRVVFGMALLAWAMLASGAIARTLPMPSAMNMAGVVSMAAVQATTTHCDDPSMRQAATHSMPVQPAGHPDCCHGACDCLASCNVVLAVPRWAGSAPLQHVVASVVIPVRPARMPAAPPLRPPII